MSYYDEEPAEDDLDYDAKIKEAAKGMTATVELPSSLLDTIAHSIAMRLELSIKAKIEKQVEAKLKELVDEAVRKVIGDRADELVREAIEKPRQKTTEWGTPTGPTVTFAELIPGIVESYLSAKVNDKGQSDPSYGKATRVGWIIASMVREHIDPVTTQAVATVTKQARDVVSQKIANFVTEQMMPAIEATKPR